MEATEKIAKWTIELSMYDIVYKPRIAIDAQALSDFVVKWTETQTIPRERDRVGILDHQLRWVLTTSRHMSRNFGNIL
jgi:hypothetical protein